MLLVTEAWSSNMAQSQRNEHKEEKQFDERVVAVDRVARVVKGGRRFRFRALVVIGDHKGKVGVGTSKGADVTAAVSKATDVAKKHMISVPIDKGTIAHEQQAKVAGANILLKPAAPGTGLIAGGVVRVVDDGGVTTVLLADVLRGGRQGVGGQRVAQAPRSTVTQRPSRELVAIASLTSISSWPSAKVG